MRLGPDGISRRIKRAGDEYVEGDIDSDELEERIERALHLEYTYYELACYEGFNQHPNAVARVLGREIEPGETLSFDDVWEFDPLEPDVCPY